MDHDGGFAYNSREEQGGTTFARNATINRVNEIMKFASALVIVAVLAILVCNADAEDWPRWRGPRGDGTWNAPAIVEKWPENGLRTVWKLLSDV